METIASLAKCFSTLIFLHPGLGIPPLVAFGLATMVYSSTLLIGYWSYFIYKGKVGDMASVQHLTLRRARDIDPTMLSAYLSFTFQAIEKHFLGEGEKFVMAVFQPPYDQGVYGLVNNLGSIVVRTVFQPFEQAIFTAFSMSTKGEKKKESLQAQANLLALLLKVVVLFAGICVAFGPSYSFTVLWFSYGRKWALTEAPKILSVYCFYIGSMALNGVAEAFMHATANEKALKRINISLIVFSILHSITSIALVRTAGTSGLVIAGCISMSIRVAYCFTYMSKHFAEVNFALASVMPGLLSLAAGGACALLGRVSERIHVPSQEGATFDLILRHFAIGCLAGLSLLALLYKSEGKTWRSLAALRKSGGNKAE